MPPECMKNIARESIRICNAPLHRGPALLLGFTRRLQNTQSAVNPDSEEMKGLDYELALIQLSYPQSHPPFSTPPTLRELLNHPYIFFLI